MSTNCIHCGIEPRTGNNLLCDECHETSAWIQMNKGIQQKMLWLTRCVKAADKLAKVLGKYDSGKATWGEVEEALEVYQETRKLKK